MRRAPGGQQDGTLHYDFLTNVRGYLALADAVPKPHPFPQEGRRQFAELREAADRADAHFRALLGAKETQLRSGDRDNLKRYAEANLRANPPQPAKPRVVFLGDSITDGWRLNEYFPEADYINRGISGQITGQMLGRMMADVIALKPKAMVLLAGTNDIARGTDPQAIQGNIEMIADLAEKHGIKPVLASILPVHDYNKDQNPAWEVSRRRPPATILAVNAWIADFCRRRNFVHLNYFPALVDPAGALRKEFAEDGLHPNAAGYRAMAPLAQAAIEKALPAAPSPAAPARKKRLGLFGGQ
jgi:lysophospholipase L1-like esterase